MKGTRFTSTVCRPPVPSPPKRPDLRKELHKLRRHFSIGEVLKGLAEVEDERVNKGIED